MHGLQSTSLQPPSAQPDAIAADPSPKVRPLVRPHPRQPISTNLGQSASAVPGDGPDTRLISRPATDFLACLAVTDYRDSPSNLSRYDFTV